MQKTELTLIGGLIWRWIIMAKGNIPYNNLYYLVLNDKWV